MPTTFEKVKDWPTFMILNALIRAGEYQHFISKMPNPIYSIYYYTIGQRYTYKILYHGTGGGLYLCIADVTLGLRPTLRSLVAITSNNIIDFCI
jgi:hypothetical protein